MTSPDGPARSSPNPGIPAPRRSRLLGGLVAGLAMVDRPWRAIAGLFIRQVDDLRICLESPSQIDLDRYEGLPPQAKDKVTVYVTNQYEVLQSEKRMLQQVENAAIAFLVAGAVAGIVVFGQAQTSLAQATVGRASGTALDDARRAASTVPVLIPLGMFSGGLFLVSLHARVRRISTYCTFLEQIIDAAAGTGAPLIS
jgi:hypothetical protein